MLGIHVQYSGCVAYVLCARVFLDEDVLGTNQEAPNSSLYCPGLPRYWILIDLQIYFLVGYYRAPVRLIFMYIHVCQAWGTPDRI